MDLRRKTDFLIILLMIAGISAIGYAAVRNYTLSSAPPTITVPTEIAVNASDPADNIVRDWGLTIDRPMVPEQKGNIVGYIGADAYGNYFSGDTVILSWTFSPGPHYLILIVGQSGGPSYGTYSGTVTINGQAYDFSGVDVTHSTTIYFTI